MFGKSLKKKERKNDFLCFAVSPCSTNNFIPLLLHRIYSCAWKSALRFLLVSVSQHVVEFVIPGEKANKF